MLYHCMCSLACFSYVYLIFFKFSNRDCESESDCESEIDDEDTEKVFTIYDNEHTTSEIIYEMNLKSSTTKVQRWWRSIDISSKRTLFTEISYKTQQDLNRISDHFTNRFTFYPDHTPTISQSIYPILSKY